MNWWLIALVVILAIFIVSKVIHFRHFKHKITAILIIFLLLFFGLSFLKVSHSNAVDLKSPAGIFSGVHLYFSWLGQVFNNLKIITGNVIRMDWFGNLTS